MSPKEFRDLMLLLSIGILIAVMALTPLVGCTAKAEAPPSTFAWKSVEQVGVFFWRYENTEAVCYRYGDALQCKWKQP